jgi:hypothetical protein
MVDGIRPSAAQHNKRQRRLDRILPRKTEAGLKASRNAAFLNYKLEEVAEIPACRRALDFASCHDHVFSSRRL